MAGNLNFLPCRPLCRAANTLKTWHQLPLELIIPGKARQKPEYCYDLITKVIHYHFCKIWLVMKISLIHSGRKLYKTQKPGGANYWGAPVILVPTLLIYSIKYFTKISQSSLFLLHVIEYVHKLFSCILY